MATATPSPSVTGNLSGRLEHYASLPLRERKEYSNPGRELGDARLHYAVVIFSL